MLPPGRFFTFVILAAGILLTSFPASAEKRVALVIGNSQYSSVPRLDNPSNDAAKLGALLKNAGFDSVIVHNDLRIGDLRRAVGDFAEVVRGADVAVVFYAGHGMEVDGTNYLVPVDAKLVRDFDIEDEAFPVDRIVKVIEPAKLLRLIILDACRDNPFLRSMKRSMGSRAISRGLAKVDDVSSGTLIAFAAKAGSVAEDGDRGNSPFTDALLRHLSRPGLDLRFAFGFVRDDVLRATRNRQEPWVYGSLGGDSIALIPENEPQEPGKPYQGRPLAVPATPAVEAADEIAVDFAQAVKKNTRPAWEAFLRLHPSGSFADRARDKLALLEQGVSDGAAKPSPDKATPSAAAATMPASQGQLPQLIYSPWVKNCGKGQDKNAKPVCFTGKDARNEAGEPVLAAALIEPDGEPKKLFRVTLPTPLQLQYGARIIIDREQPMTGSFLTCFASGCMVDYEATAELVRKLEKGQMLTVQAINLSGSPISFPLPLTEFQKTRQGPPTDPKLLDQKQNKP